MLAELTGRYLEIELYKQQARNHGFLRAGEFPYN